MAFTWNNRQYVIMGLAAIALGLGLGLGLGLRGTSQWQPTTNNTWYPTVNSTSQPTANSTWKPAVNSTWQIVLSNPIDTSNPDCLTPDVDIWDIDLFTNPESTISTLKSMGKRVICYWSAGSYESYRPDSGEFDQEDLGLELDGWPGERWLNLSSPNVRDIMKARMELSHEKGCDGVDPDNVDGFVSGRIFQVYPC